MSLFAPATAQLLHELGADAEDGIVFARVTRVVAKAEHRLDDGSYSHYFGFGRLESTGARVWFKKDAALRCLHLGVDGGRWRSLRG